MDSTSLCFRKSNISKITCCALLTAYVLTGCAPRPAERVVPLIETDLRKVFAYIDSGDAHHLYPLILQEERDKESLTEEQLVVLLRVLKRYIKDATPGPIVLNGDTGGLSGVVIYRMPDKTELTIVAYCRPMPDGTIGARGLISALLSATAAAESLSKKRANSTQLDAIKGQLAGLKDIHNEMGSNGPQAVLGPKGTETFDAYISHIEDNVKYIEAHGGNERRSGA